MNISTQSSPALETLQKLFYAKSIALIGASDRSPWSHMIHANLANYAFKGKVYAVNKHATPAHGLSAYVSCTALPEIPDTAFIFVPVDAVLEALADAAAAGIKTGVVLTSGFSETGEEGATLQERVIALARDNGMLLLGPNSLGFANVSASTPMTPIPPVLPILPGVISLASQSGATNSEIVEFAHQINVGVNLFIATGNESMIDIAACVNFLVEDENTRVVMVFAESIRDTATFQRAARAALAKNKPIVILKVGATELTAKVAAAHTGSLVGDDRVFDAACRQLGVIRVHSVEELVTTAALLAHTGVLQADGVGITSISGGACTLFADRASVHGVPLPEFSPQTQQRLRDMLPSLPGTMNPLDITGAAIRDASLLAQSLRIVGDDPSVGFVGCIYNLPWHENRASSHIASQLAAVGEGLRSLKQPGALIVQTSKPVTEVSRRLLHECGIDAVFGGIDDVTQALGHARWWSNRVKQGLPPAVEPVQLSTARPEGERGVLAYLASCGVPVVPSTLAQTRGEAEAVAAASSGPLVLKIASPDIAHKTEVGGVKLGLLGTVAVGEAFDVMLAAVASARPDARIEGVLVSPMYSGGLEILVGTVNDPQWGAVLAVGLGGVWVEALDDTQLRLLPVNHSEAASMLKSLRAAKLLNGFRGSPPVDLDRLAAVIVAIGNAALSLGDGLEALEVNPLWVHGSDITALDGLTVWTGAKA